MCYYIYIVSYEKGAIKTAPGTQAGPKSTIYFRGGKYGEQTCGKTGIISRGKSDGKDQTESVREVHEKGLPARA